MIERKNIDRLFQEKFKDFEVAPSEKIWDNIEAELKEKKKRRVIPFWFRLSGVAAALLIGFLISYRLMNSEGKPEQKIVLEDKNDGNPKAIGTENQDNTNTNNKPENITVDSNSAASQDKSGKNQVNNGNPSDVANKNTEGNPTNKKSAIPQKANTNQAVAVSEIKRNKKSGSALNKNIGSQNKNSQPTNRKNAIANTGNENNPNHAVAQQTRNDSENKSVSNPNLDKAIAPFDQNTNTTNTNIVNNTIENKSTDSKSNAITIAENIADKKLDTTAIATVVPNALEELLNEKENEVTAKEPKLNRWQVASSIAPIYFSSTSNGSPLDSRFESNKKSYKPTVSYGVGVQYALNKKLALRSGVSAVKLEYNTSDLVFFQTNNARQIQNVNANIQGSVLQIDNKPIQFNMAARAGDNKFDATLNQKTGYIEVPIELSYKLIDNKFGIEIIGGISTLFLNQNEVSLESPGIEMNIGEANNLNSLHFSTNVGVGIKYNFLKAFQANFEPMFKYQMNTFSNDAGNFKPYFFGFYTGVSYRF
jgi:hypothetical protein